MADDSKGGSESGLVDVPYLGVFVSALPLLAFSVVLYYMKAGISRQVWISSIRSFVQLTILGYVLKPILIEGAKNFWIVFVYLIAMVALSAIEISGRPKYRFKHQFLMLFMIVMANVGFVSVFAFSLVIKAPNPWDPKYVVPICGMLFGNIINSVSLALNSILSAFVELRNEIDLMLCFGATKFEASVRLMREAVRAGSMPTLNSMAIIGLVSIPGMMTGQVLGGSPPDIAARYQMMIMYLIAVCGLCSILSVLITVTFVCFNSEDALRDSALSKSVKNGKGFGARFILLKARLTDIAAKFYNLVCFIDSEESNGYYQLEGADDEITEIEEETVQITTSGSPKNSVVLSIYKKLISDDDSIGGNYSDTYFGFEDISRFVPIAESTSRRELFSGIGFDLAKGDVALVSGPSGSGKSQLLRLIAGLVEKDKGQLYLNGKCRDEFSNMRLWRRKVRYVTQYKVDIPGTPHEFLKCIADFEANKIDVDAPSFDEMYKITLRLLSEWGMNEYSLDTDWKLLSGGESQRMILAICLASRPMVLLLDESTSALDSLSKKIVEESILRYIQSNSIVALWISHDEEKQVQFEEV